MKFIDKIPEETRDEKYAEDFKDLKKRVVDALKKKDPHYAPWRMKCLELGGVVVSVLLEMWARPTWLLVANMKGNGHFLVHLKALKKDDMDIL